MNPETEARVSTVFDSTHQQVGEQYARALLAHGQASGNAAGLMQELEDFCTAMQSLPGLAKVLESPRIAASDKEQMLAKALDGRASRDFLNFVRLLVRRGRFDCLSAIRSAAVRLGDELAGRVRGIVTAASPMSDDAVRRLASGLGRRLGREVVLAPRVDPSIIGGVVVRVGDTVYDSSVRSRLQQMKQRAAARAADAIREQFGRFAQEA